MIRQICWSILAIFITWSVLDFLIHGLLLQSSYEATAHLWRPMEEMKMFLMYIVTLTATACFVAIYGFLVTEKSLLKGFQFGVLFGLATGASMGFGSYSYMPVPISLAWSWFFAAFIEAAIAGLIVGAIVKPA